MTISQTSRLHITNLPSEIIHQIQGDLEKIRGVAGVKSIYNLATTCRTMYNHACDNGRLKNIDQRYSAFKIMPLHKALTLAQDSSNKRLAKATQERLEDDLNFGGIKPNSESFHQVLSCNNKSLNKLAYSKWANEISTTDYTHENLQSLVNYKQHSNQQIKQAATSKLIEWANQGVITGLEPELQVSLHELDTELGQALLASFHRALSDNRSVTSVFNIEQDLINSSIPEIQDLYTDFISNKIQKGIFSIHQPGMHQLHQTGPAKIRSAIEKVAENDIRNNMMQGDTYFNQQFMIDSNNWHIRNYAFAALSKKIAQNQAPAETLISHYFLNSARPDIKELAAIHFQSFIMTGKLTAPTPEKYLDIMRNNPHSFVRSAAACEYFNEYYNTRDCYASFLSSDIPELKSHAQESMIAVPELHDLLFQHLPADQHAPLISKYAEAIKSGSYHTHIQPLLQRTELNPEIQFALEQALTNQYLKQELTDYKVSASTTGTRIIERATQKGSEKLEAHIHYSLRSLQNNEENLTHDQNNILGFFESLNLLSRRDISAPLKKDLSTIATKHALNDQSLLSPPIAKILKKTNPEITNLLMNKIYSDISNGDFDDILRDSIHQRNSNSCFLLNYKKEFSNFINKNTRGPNFTNTDLLKIEDQTLMHAITQRYKIILQQEERLVILNGDDDTYYKHPFAIIDLPEFYTNPNETIPEAILKIKNEALYDILKHKPNLTTRMSFENELYCHETENLKNLVLTSALKHIENALNDKSKSSVNSIVKRPEFWTNPSPRIQEKHDSMLRAYLKRTSFYDTKSSTFKIINEHAPEHLISKYSIDLNKAEKHDNRIKSLKNFIADKPLPISITAGATFITFAGLSKIKHIVIN